MEKTTANFLDPIRNFATRCEYFKNFDMCIELLRHAIEIAYCCNQSITSDLVSATNTLAIMVRNNLPPRPKVALEVFEKTVLEYEKQTEKLRRELETDPREDFKRKLKEEKKAELHSLFDCLLRLLQFFTILCHSLPDRRYQSCCKRCPA